MRGAEDGTNGRAAGARSRAGLAMGDPLRAGAGRGGAGLDGAGTGDGWGGGHRHWRWLRLTGHESQSQFINLVAQTQLSPNSRKLSVSVPHKHVPGSAVPMPSTACIRPAAA